MNHIISLEQVITMTDLYRSSIPEGMPISETFELASVNTLLSQSGCTALRIYYGKKEDGTIHAILVGVNEKGEDITKGVILEEGNRCPPYCPPTSILSN
jgi:hypothetical protein